MQLPRFLLSITILFCVGCSSEYNGALSKEEVLEMNPNADIIVLEDDRVYKHGVDWIEEREFTKGEKIGTVNEGMATKTPVGATIYETNEPGGVLIVEYEETSKRYLLQLGE